MSTATIQPCYTTKSPLRSVAPSPKAKPSQVTAYPPPDTSQR